MTTSQPSIVDKDVFPDGSMEAGSSTGGAAGMESGASGGSSSASGSGGGSGGQDAEVIPTGDGGCHHRDSTGNPDCDDTLVSNADFNRGIAGWAESNATVGVKWNPADSEGSKGSGSLEVTAKNVASLNGWDGSDAAAQCVPATPGTTYNFSAEVFIPPGQTYGDAELGVWFYKGTTCAGLPDNNQAYVLPPSDVTNQWVPVEGSLVTPASDESMAIRLAPGKPFQSPPLRVLFDAIRVRAQQ